jgi:hypothetical protein
LEKEKTIDDALQGLVGHRVRLHTVGRDGEMREHVGIIRGVSRDVIRLIIFGDYGEKVEEYLNRHAGVLASVLDEGLENGPEK